MDKFKSELDLFDEHHLGNILFDMYDEDERSYVHTDRELMVEGIERQRFENISMSQNQKFIIETIKLYDEITFNIYTLSDKKVLWRNFTIKEKDKISGCNLINNLFYYFTFNNKTLYILDFNTNIKWKIPIRFQTSGYFGCDLKVLPNGKILILFQTYFYIMNLDGSYYTIAGKKVDFLSPLYSICGNKLYIFSKTSRLVTCYDTDTSKISVGAKYGAKVNNIIVTENFTIIESSLRYLNIYGKKNIGMDLNKYCRSKINYIHIKVNKDETKLVLIIDTIGIGSYKTVLSLEPSSFGEQIGSTIFYKDLFLYRLGFIDSHQESDTETLDVSQYKEIVVKSKEIKFKNYNLYYI
jgi:hypothetical protein